MATDLEKTLKDARMAAAFAFSCVILVGVLLMIDGQRNKIMLGHVEDARRILEEFRQAVSHAAGTVTQAPVVGGGAADAGGTGGDGAAGVVADAVAGAGVDPAGGAAARSPNGQFARRAGMAGGPRGDG